MRKLIFISLMAVLLSGCYTMQNLDELLTLKGVGDSFDEMDVEIDAYNEKFYALFAEAQKDTFRSDYSLKESILNTFTTPIMIKEIQQDGKIIEEWVYRRGDFYFNTDRVYLYFNEQDQLIDVKIEYRDKEKEES